MPRHISFALTTRQFLDDTKDVTRRTGWKDAKAGDVLVAVEKSQGLRKGEHIKPLGLIRLVTVRHEKLGRLIDDPTYGRAETAREGFPYPHELCDPEKFLAFFCETHRRCGRDTVITRLEFERIR